MCTSMSTLSPVFAHAADALTYNAACAIVYADRCKYPLWSQPQVALQAEN